MGSPPSFSFSDLHPLTSSLLTSPTHPINNNDHPPTHMVVPLSALDAQYPLRVTCVAPLFVFKGDVDGERLEEALRKVVDANPILAGRFATPEMRAIRCSNVGLPFSTQLWPSGSLACFPACVKASWAGDDIDAGRKDIRAPGTPLVQDIDYEAMVRGEDAFLKVTLTHLGVDGACVVGLHVSHAVADAGRYHRLMADICDAYHGRPLTPAAYMCRSSVAPSNFMSCLDTKEEESQVLSAVENVTAAIVAEIEVVKHTHLSDVSIPRLALDSFHIAPFQPDAHADKVTARSVECLHIPEPTLDTLKASVRALAAKSGVDSSVARAISTNDIVTALHWLIKSQVYGWPLPGQEDDKGSVAGIVVDIARNPCLNGRWNLPDGFFGNAIAPLLCGPASKLQDGINVIATSDDAEEERYRSLLTMAACAVRTSLNNSRTPISVAVGAGLTPILYSPESWIALPKVMQLPPVRTYTTNWCGYERSKIDFGSGEPSFIFGSFTRPWLTGLALIMPACGVEKHTIQDNYSYSGVYLLMNAEEPRFSAWREREGGWVKVVAKGVDWV